MVSSACILQTVLHTAHVPQQVHGCDSCWWSPPLTYLQVDHSIIMYLVNPKGEFVDYYGQNRTAEEMVGGVASHMIAYNRSQ